MKIEDIIEHMKHECKVRAARNKGWGGSRAQLRGGAYLIMFWDGEVRSFSVARAGYAPGSTECMKLCWHAGVPATAKELPVSIDRNRDPVWYARTWVWREGQ